VAGAAVGAGRPRQYRTRRGDPRLRPATAARGVADAPRTPRAAVATPRGRPAASGAGWTCRRAVRPWPTAPRWLRGATVLTETTPLGKEER